MRWRWRRFQHSANTQGVGSSGDVNFTGGGGRPGLVNSSSGQSFAPGGDGGRAIRTRAAADLGATETITVGAAGAQSGANSRTGQAGWIITYEILEA